MGWGNDHECEVKRRDLDDIRWEAERKIEELENRILHLERRVTCLVEEVAALWNEKVSRE